MNFQNIYFIKHKQTYHVTHEVHVATIAHAQWPLHEGHNSVEGVHVSPVHVVLEKKSNVFEEISVGQVQNWQSLLN